MARAFIVAECLSCRACSSGSNGSIKDNDDGGVILKTSRPAKDKRNSFRPGIAMFDDNSRGRNPAFINSFQKSALSVNWAFSPRCSVSSRIFEGDSIFQNECGVIPIASKPCRSRRRSRNAHLPLQLAKSESKPSLLSGSAWTLNSCRSTARATARLIDCKTAGSLTWTNRMTLTLAGWWNSRVGWKNGLGVQLVPSRSCINSRLGCSIMEVNNAWVREICISQLRWTGQWFIEDDLRQHVHEHF